MSRKINTLIVGAGKAGKIIADELLQSDSVWNVPVAFADDDDAKIGTAYKSIPVAGKIKDISEITKKHCIY